MLGAHLQVLVPGVPGYLQSPEQSHLLKQTSSRRFRFQRHKPRVSRCSGSREKLSLTDTSSFFIIETSTAAQPTGCLAMLVQRPS